MATADKLILVVDDTPLNISVITGALKDTYRTKVATNGPKALTIAAAEEKPDLILLDVMMPEMDGYEVCRRLKADPSTREIPVIFLTAQTEAEDETRGFEVGAVDYVHKPFSPAVMKARVHTHLVLRETRAKLARQLQTIQQELETARKIQLSILPSQLPTIRDLDIATRYIPMTSVAGDFYDFIVVDEQHVGILVADVSGHGMPAALIASMLKIALAAQQEWASDPAKVLSGLNQSLCGKFHDHYVTAAYVYLDMEKRIARYGGAGHPPILMCSGTTGRVQELDENGFFLSWIADATYSSKEIPLSSGDWIVLYSDGITETVNRSEEEFGRERFRAFIEKNSFLTPDEFATKLLEEVHTFSGRTRDEESDDDTTLALVHIRDMDIVIQKA